MTKKRRATKDLIDIWRKVQNGETWCAGDDDCLAEANVYLYSIDEGDVYMCPRHAAMELDR
jgi:hypothetical protein